ncbi:MAG: hypothetical protein JW787_12820 [Sedimentisphaerales bacterium]|nr:hypothetical protein [Sedimentisphaerales bacterium]
MSLIWTICGAGQGVGKTTLALKLCEVLPESIYVKCGHGAAKSGKPGIFFNNLTELDTFMQANRNIYKHIIVESNAFAKLSKSDIFIYLDGVIGKTHFRSDAGQLMASADISVCMDTALESWKKVLASKIGSEAVCEAVCDLLLSQKKYLLSRFSDI